MKHFWTVFFLLASVSTANAWTLLQFPDPNNVVPSGWDMESRNGVLRIDVNYSRCDITPAEVNTALDLAIDLWNSIPMSGMRLERGVEVTTEAGADPPVIFCDNDGTLGIDTDGTAGIGGPTNIDVATGRLTAGRLVLNSRPTHNSRMSNLSETLRAVIVAHELGHTFGFGHTSDTTSIMYFDASAKEQLRFSQDDIDAIAYLYPRNELGQDGILGCASVGTPGPPSGGGGTGLFVLGLLAIVAVGRSVILHGIPRREAV